jgi:hypothetical protein
MLGALFDKYYFFDIPFVLPFGRTLLFSMLTMFCIDIMR